jgi:hypothetical protein
VDPAPFDCGPGSYLFQLNGWATASRATVPFEAAQLAPIARGFGLPTTIRSVPAPSKKGAQNRRRVGRSSGFATLPIWTNRRLPSGAPSPLRYRHELIPIPPGQGICQRQASAQSSRASGNSKACPIAFCPTVNFAPCGPRAQAHGAARSFHWGERMHWHARLTLIQCWASGRAQEQCSSGCADSARRHGALPRTRTGSRTLTRSKSFSRDRRLPFASRQLTDSHARLSHRSADQAGSPFRLCDLSQYPEYARRVGEIVAAWSMIELGLSIMFGMLLRGPPWQAWEAFFAINNAKARINMLRALALTLDDGIPEKPGLLALLKRCQNAPAARHGYAHLGQAPCRACADGCRFASAFGR